MKRFLRLSICALLAILGVTTAWAETTVTLDATSDTTATSIYAENGKDVIEATLEKDGITLHLLKAGNKSGGGYLKTNTDYRIWKSATLAVISSIGKITKIELTCTATGAKKYGPGCLITDVGTYTYEEDGKGGTWTGAADSVVFTASTNQARIVTMTVTVADDKTATELTFAETSGTVKMGEAFSLPELTLKAGGTTLTGKSYTYESSNESVATVASDGTVTLVGEGTTNITATYAGDGTYSSSSAVYALTVEAAETGGEEEEEETGSTIYQKVTSSSDLVAGKKYIIVYEAGPALFGEFSEKDYGISVTDGVEINNSEVDIAGLAVSKFTLSGEEGAWQLSTGGKYMAWTSGNKVKTQDSADDEGTTWTITSTDDGYILTNTKKDTQKDQEVDRILQYNAANNSLRFACYYTSQKPAVLYVQKDESATSVERPTFSVESGDYTEAQTVTISCETSGATIYYTTDGSEPTTSSTQYTGPVTISSTTTLKAIAAVGSSTSGVSSATYTITEILESIAEVKALSSGDKFTLKLTNAQVIYVNGTDVYVQDETGAILFYRSGLEVETGQTLNGTISGKYSPYNGLPEIADASDASGITATEGDEPEPTVIEESAVADHLCELVRINNTTVAVRDNYKVFGDKKTNLSISSDCSYDIVGIAVVYEKNGTATYQIYPRTTADLIYNLDESKTSSQIPTEYKDSVSVDLTRTLKSDHWNTLCLPFDASSEQVAAALGEGTQVATCTIDGDTVNFNMAADATISAGVPVIVKPGEIKDEYAFVGVTLATDLSNVEGTNYSLVGTFDPMTVSSGDYFIYDDKVYESEGSTTLTAFRAYIQSNGGGARPVLTIDGQTTGINGIGNDGATTGRIFNLRGQEVKSLKRGLYIVNGQKVVR